MSSNELKINDTVRMCVKLEDNSEYLHVRIIYKHASWAEDGPHNWETSTYIVEQVGKDGSYSIAEQCWKSEKLLLFRNPATPNDLDIVKTLEAIENLKLAFEKAGVVMLYSITEPRITIIAKDNEDGVIDAEGESKFHKACQRLLLLTEEK